MDLYIRETGNGGDALQAGNDLLMTDSVSNMVYLALFGGNEDWWGNELFLPNEPGRQFRSETETTLKSVALNSAGRQKIEQAVLNDLAFMKAAIPGTAIAATVYLTGADSLRIEINIDGEELVYLWNNGIIIQKG